MGYKHDTTRRIDSVTCLGVSAVLRKMTEGRRLELRKLISEPNRRIREIIREQANIEKMSEEERDMPKWLELQDEFEEIMVGTVNPAWIEWGVKQIEGLEVDGRSLGVSDWKDWPSALFNELVSEVKEEAELNGAERKNFESPTTSGALAVVSQSPSTAANAGSAGGGESETVASISQAE